MVALLKVCSKRFDRASLLAFVLALLLIGISAVVWADNEGIVAWLLAEGVIEESVTRTLPGTVKDIALWSGIASLTIVALVALWVLFGITPWAPVQAFATSLKRALRRLVIPVWSLAVALFRTLRRGLALMLRPLGLGLSAVVGAVSLAVDRMGQWVTKVLESLRQVTSATVHLLWQVTCATVRPLGLGLSAVVGAVSLAVDRIRQWVTKILESLRQVTSATVDLLWHVVCAIARLLGLVFLALAHAASLAVDRIRQWLTTVLESLRQVASAGGYLLWQVVGATTHPLRLGLSAVAHAVNLAVDRIRQWVATVVESLSQVASAVGHLLWQVVGATIHPLRLGLSAVAHAASLVLGYVQLGFATVFRYLVLGVTTVAQAVGLTLGYVWLGFATVLRYLGLGVSTALLGVRWTLLYLWMGFSTLLGYLWRGISASSQPVGLALGYAWLGVSTAAIVLGWPLTGLLRGGSMAIQGVMTSSLFVIRTVVTAYSVIANVGVAAVRSIQQQKEVPALSDLNLTRQRVLSLIATLWVFAILGSMLAWTFWPAPPEPTVEVEHWATGHLMREGENIRLLPVMAEQFNRAGHRTKAGTRIVVKVHNVPSELIAEYLVPRVNNGRRIDLTRLSDGYVKPGYSDPAVVTPSSAHWLVTVNHEVGHNVVDLGSAQSIVRPVIGIVTYEEMARCLGWPDKELGYADIPALRADPDGWSKYPCARSLWGKRPLVAFTDPSTSSTGRSLLLGLYSIAAGKDPQELTKEDVVRDEVVGYVKEFQGLIDHYLIGTTVLNTKIYQGPRYGHFFIMPEDNLIHLYEGTERAFINGVKVQPPPIAPNSMVMIYPKEGSMPRSNCACIIQADWVTPEQAEAAQQWIDFLLEGGQQRNFMAAGFRPGGDISLTDPSSKISARYGLDPAKPTVTLNPSLIDPAVAAAIDDSWELVKIPRIVTFVVDTSGSMLGNKINQARDGLVRALDNMARNNQVGLVTFDDTINTTIPIGPLMDNRFDMVDAVLEMRARGETALYDAIKVGIEMTDAAEGEGNAIRAVVILTDGRANKGQTRLDDLIMMSRKEVLIRQFSGFEDDSSPVDENGTRVSKKEVYGTELGISADHDIQIFFIGIGDDADQDVGRMLAEATGAEFQRVAEEDLANVLEEFSKYF